MNKTLAVKNHLETIGHITSMEAINLFGATRLSGIIYNLRNNYGMNITNKKNKMKDRFGHTCYYDTYILVKE